MMLSFLFWGMKKAPCILHSALRREKLLSVAEDGDKNEKDQPERKGKPDGGHNPDPRPADTADQPESDKQNGQQAAKADAAGTGAVVFHGIPPENGHEKTTVRVHRGL